MLARLLFILLTPFLFLSGNDKMPVSTSTSQYQAHKAAPKAVNNAVKTLKLMFAGDIMSQIPQIESARMASGEHNYDHCFQYIRPVFKKADLVIGNLECTLRESPPYTGYPNFRSPDQLAEALKKGGFDVLVTSNNHSLDGGLEGVLHTIDVVRKNGFVQTGTFKNDALKKLTYPLILYKNGFKIALLNYTHHTNGISPKPPAIVNRLDIETYKKDLHQAKKMKPDFIISFLHWGEEHQLNEGSNERGLAHLMHQWGSDLVVGSHPHVVQPIKNEAVKVGNQTHNFLTAYSLGNFISAQPFVNTEGGIIFEVNISKQGSKTVIDDFYYIPVLRYTPYEKGKMRFYALPTSPYENGDNNLNISASEKAKLDNFVARVRRQMDEYGTPERKFTLNEVQIE